MTISQEQLSILRDRMEEKLGCATFRSYLSDANFVADVACTNVQLIVSSKFRADRLNEHHKFDIQNVISQVFGKSISLEIEANSHCGQPETQQLFEADEQYNMFVPTISEVSIKDDVHLMGIAPFTLQPRGDTRTRLCYRNIDGMDIDIKAHPDYGLPTPMDFNIVLMMESHLAASANHYRRALNYYQTMKKTGRTIEKPNPPPRVFRPTVKEIMEFTRDHDTKLGKRYGGKQASVLELRLDRLKNTNAKIRQTGNRRKRVGTFSYIGDWRVVSETETGNIEQVEIEYPDWIYAGIVEAVRPTILTYDDDYELLKQPIMMFLYRVLRSKVTDNHKEFYLEDLHRRSGSRQPLKEFNRTLIERVDETEKQGFFDWSLSIQGNARQRKLVVTTRVPASEEP